MNRLFHHALPFLFAFFGLLFCGCEPGAGHVEIWVTPKKDSWNQSDSTPIEVSVGQTVQFEGQRVLPGAHPEHAIKSLHRFTLHCDPKDSVEFDTDNRKLTFKQAGKVTVWFIEKAPGFARQSQEPVEDWDKHHLVDVNSNRLYFVVK